MKEPSNRQRLVRRCLLLLLVPALGFPLASFAQTYTSYVAPGVFLANNGFAYKAAGRFGSMYPPGQTIPMSQMMFEGGRCGAGNNDGCYQVIGLGKQDGFAYLVGFWNLSNVWTSGGILPGQQTRFSQLQAAQGWGNNGGFWNSGGGYTTVYKSNFLQVIGLGSNDGFAYLAAFQDLNGTWHSGGILPGQTIPFSQLYVIYGNSGQLQLIGRAVSDNRLYLTAYQDDNGNWNASGLLPGQSPSSSSVTVALGNPNAAVQVLSLGADGYVYLSNWQDSKGTWHPSGILPGQSTPLKNIVATPIAVPDSNAIGGYTSQLIVGGIGASDHIFHFTNWQDDNGSWNAYSASPAPVPQVPLAQAFGFYGIGQNNHIYLLADEYPSTGVWSSGYDLTPTRVAPNALLPIINFLLLQ